MAVPVASHVPQALNLREIGSRLLGFGGFGFRV